jgi:glycine cleavage system H lipoate-binding protein
MHLVLAIVTIAVLIGISYFSESRKRKLLSDAAPEGSLIQFIPHHRENVEELSMPAVAVLPGTSGNVTRIEGYALPESLHYHQGHTWAAPQNTGLVMVGVSEFAAKVLGAPTSIRLPRAGETCRQGMPAFRLSRNGKALDMLSPLDGQVVAVNGRVLDDPETIVNEPYGNGWLMMIKPRELKSDLRNLISGTVARSWMEESAMVLRSLFNPSLGPVFADGGTPEVGLSGRLSSKEWDTLAHRVFMVEQ